MTIAAIARSRHVRIFTPIAALLLLVSVAIRAEDRVYPNAESVTPLAPGAQVPSARVETVEGERVDLAKLVRDRGALLVFYRGGW